MAERWGYIFQMNNPIIVDVNAQFVWHRITREGAYLQLAHIKTPQQEKEQLFGVIY
jgi:hypothetical protein